jgi:sugar lactone lactonase YvrE
MRLATRRFSVLLLWLLPAMLVSCGSFFQGPVTGSIQLDKPADAADAVAFLRCSGGFIHGDVTTDAEDTRVNAKGQFRFLGSFSLPVTERCYIYIRHPRYLTAHVLLKDDFAQTLPTLILVSWEAFFAAGPEDQVPRGGQRPWPETQVRRHISETQRWLQSFSSREQRDLVRYVPDIHTIYRNAIRYGGVDWSQDNVPDIVKGIGRIEALTGFAYPYQQYPKAVKEGDAPRVQALLDGGVLREAWSRGMPLYTAAENGHVEVVDVLLAAGEPLNFPGCRAPLLAALGADQWAMALKLIRLEAELAIDCRNKPGMGDVLTRWARAGNLDLLTDFFEAGVPVDMLNRQGTTALAEAVTIGRIEVVKVLLERGADPNVHTAAGVALLDDAVAKGYLDVERALRARQGVLAVEGDEVAAAGEPIILPWRRGLPMPYRVHSNYGQVTTLVADPKEPGTLWLGTRGGLLRLKPETGARRAWTRVNGLPSSAVGRLWFDEHRRFLWVATSGGLARLPLDDLDRMETVGDREPHSSHASGFLGASDDGGVWFWGDNHLYNLHTEAGEALRYSPAKTLHGMTATPDGDGFFLVDGSHIWRIKPGRGERTLILDASELDASELDANDLAQLPVKGPAGAPELRSLALDASQRYLWISTFRHGVFRLALDSGVVAQTVLDTEQLDRCARSKVDYHMHGQVTLAGDAVYAQLEGCFGRIDEGNRFTVLRDRIMAGPVADAGGDTWYVDAAGFHRVDAHGKTRRFPFPPDPVSQPQVTALLAADGKLFVGVDDAPLVVLDLQQHVFTTITGVTDVQRLRRVAGRDDVLALGRTRYWWVDQETLVSKPLVLRPPGSQQFRAAEWKDVRDLEYDGSAFWVLRDARSLGSKSRNGLFRLSTEGVKYFKSAGNYSLGRLVTLAQDSGQPNLLWLVTDRDPALVDFDKTLATSERLGKRSMPPRPTVRPESFLADSRLCGLTLKRNQACDPDVAGLVWELSGSQLFLRRGAKILHRWPARLPTGAIVVTRSPDTTVWVATREGLIEYPIPEQLEELLTP